MAKKSKVKPKLKPKKKLVARSKAKPATRAAAKPKTKLKVKSAAKSKVKPRAKVAAKAKLMTTKSKKIAKARDLRSRPVVKESPIAIKRIPIKSDSRPAGLKNTSTKMSVPVVKRIVNQMVERRRPVKRPTRVNQFNFMKAPGIEHAFEVGGGVEVFCDHEKSKERIRGWVKGIVVQVDNKMVAVQFRSNVYLTDGWMVPDRILWFPLNSENMRLIPGKKTVTKDLIPDY